MTAEWIELLNDAVAAERQRTGRKRGAITIVAEKIGMSRSAVSTAMRGEYPGATHRIEARVLKVFGGGRVLCPHLGHAIEGALCQSWQTRAQPRSNPDALRHWTACRACPIAGVSVPAPPVPQPQEAT